MKLCDSNYDAISDQDNISEEILLHNAIIDVSKVSNINKLLNINIPSILHEQVCILCNIITNSLIRAAASSPSTKSGSKTNSINGTPALFKSTRLLSKSCKLFPLSCSN